MDYWRYTPVGAIASIIKHDVERFADEEVRRDDQLQENGRDQGAVQKGIGVILFIMAVSLVSFVFNLIGIVYEFKCQYVTLGVVSIIGLFFGLPIGLIFYLVYLVNPSICAK